MRRISLAEPGSANRRWALLLASLLLLAMLLNLALNPAQAAQLPISGAKITTVTTVADRCTTAVSVTHGAITGSTANTVTVNGLAARCVGRALALTLFDKEGEVIRSAAVPSLTPDANGSVSISVDSYAPAAVAGAAVTIGPWGVPATWTYAPPIVSCRVINNPSKTCSATQVGFAVWPEPSPTTYYLQFRVESATVTRDDEWEITVNLADPSLRLLATHIKALDNNVVLAPGWSCSTMPLLVLRGKGGSQYVGDWAKVWVGLEGTSLVSQDSGHLVTCA